MIRKSIEDIQGEWNLQMINTTNSFYTPSEKVKVALIDSGVDYSTDIDVAVRKNFISEQEEISIIYEDLTGHGTSVAGIIAAKDNNEGITGINPNVELYSARVLDENLSAPISRVVDAIYWAIDQDVNIINISFGTTVNSSELYNAIAEAYNNGILIIAAAGNKGIVEYPAAYDEVIAVGSVDSMGNLSKGSAVGEELDLVAPGEQILSTGAFGGVLVSGGTSMAAPHITGVASALWEKDLNCSAEFIRTVLTMSANKYGSKEEYGYGLVDYEHAERVYYALKIMNAGRSFFGTDSTFNFDSKAIEETLEATIEENDSAITVFDDVDYVEGSWGEDEHEALSAVNGSDTGKPLSSAAIKIVKLGAIAPDEYVEGMVSNPEWHGFISCKPNNVVQYYSNYMSAYIYLTEIASEVYTGTNPLNVQPSVYITDNVKNNILKIFRSNNAGLYNYDLDGTNSALSWSTVLNNNTVNNRNKALFIYGMALHTAADMFAHSSYDSDGNYISHDDVDNDGAKDADDTGYVKNRDACALLFAGELVAHIKQFEDASITDYYNVASSTTYDGSFTIGKFSAYAKQIDSSYYTSNKSTFDAMSY